MVLHAVGTGAAGADAMKVEVHESRVSLDDTEHSRIVRRVQLGLGRYAGDVSRISVTVHLIEEWQWLCCLRLRSRRAGLLVVEGSDATLSASTDRTVARVERELRRRMAAGPRYSRARA